MDAFVLTNQFFQFCIQLRPVLFSVLKFRLCLVHRFRIGGKKFLNHFRRINAFAGQGFDRLLLELILPLLELCKFRLSVSDIQTAFPLQLRFCLFLPNFINRFAEGRKILANRCKHSILDSRRGVCPLAAAILSLDSSVVTAVHRTVHALSAGIDFCVVGPDQSMIAMRTVQKP